MLPRDAARKGKPRETGGHKAADLQTVLGSIAVHDSRAAEAFDEGFGGSAFFCETHAEVKRSGNLRSENETFNQNNKKKDLARKRIHFGGDDCGHVHFWHIGHRHNDVDGSAHTEQ